MNIIMPLPQSDFDPTESALTWKILKEAELLVKFATPQGAPAMADPVMVTGRGLGPLKYILRAPKSGRLAYKEMLKDKSFQKPLSYADIDLQSFDAIVLPGGHAKGIREYLESKTLQSIIGQFFKKKKLVAAICHGVVLVSRSQNENGKSVLWDKKTTALPYWMEMLAYNLTRLWMGSYYLTYEHISVQKEVIESLNSSSNFIVGPYFLTNNFVVQDQNYISARWPGDVPKFAQSIIEFLRRS